MQNIAELKALLDTPKNIIITTHQKPDGDALGASLALYHYLKRKGHNVNVISPTDFPSYFNWMPAAANVLDFEKNENETKKLITNAALIFCVDFNDLNRINDMQALVADSKAKIVLIDHHTDPKKFDHFRLIDSKASSSSELVYDFIALLMNEPHLIDASIAQCLYTGIMTDTGSFRFSGTTSKVHRIIADLIDKGIDNTSIHEHIFDNVSENRLKFLGYCINEKLTILPEYKTAFISLTSDELKKFNIETGDTEGIVNYALSVSGVIFAAIIVDRTKVVKLSFRSKGKFAVNKFAKEHFNGGGHINASGGYSDLTLNQTVEKFKNILSDYKDILLNN